MRTTLKEFPYLCDVFRIHSAQVGKNTTVNAEAQKLVKLERRRHRPPSGEDGSAYRFALRFLLLSQFVVMLFCAIVPEKKGELSCTAHHDCLKPLHGTTSKCKNSTP
jgi:hypothetical protein